MPDSNSRKSNLIQPDSIQNFAAINIPPTGDEDRMKLHEIESLESVILSYACSPNNELKLSIPIPESQDQIIDLSLDSPIEQAAEEKRKQAQLEFEKKQNQLKEKKMRERELKEKEQSEMREKKLKENFEREEQLKKEQHQKDLEIKIRQDLQDRLKLEEERIKEIKKKEELILEEQRLEQLRKEEEQIEKQRKDHEEKIKLEEKLKLEEQLKQEELVKLELKIKLELEENLKLEEKKKEEERIIKENELRKREEEKLEQLRIEEEKKEEVRTEEEKEQQRNENQFRELLLQKMYSDSPSSSPPVSKLSSSQITPQIFEPSQVIINDENSEKAEDSQLVLKEIEDEMENQIKQFDNPSLSEEYQTNKLLAEASALLDSSSPLQYRNESQHQKAIESLATNVDHIIDNNIKNKTNSGGLQYESFNLTGTDSFESYPDIDGIMQSLNETSFLDDIDESKLVVDTTVVVVPGDRREYFSLAVIPDKTPLVTFVEEVFIVPSLANTPTIPSNSSRNNDKPEDASVPHFLSFTKNKNARFFTTEDGEKALDLSDPADYVQTLYFNI